MSQEFRNIKGFSSRQLSVDDDETPDAAIERHRANGYIILGYRLSEDPNGHTVLIPGDEEPPKQKEEADDVSTTSTED
jgi:hypothetical protein